MVGCTSLRAGVDVVREVSKDDRVVGDVTVDVGGVGKAARAISRLPPKVETVLIVEAVLGLDLPNS